MTTMDDVMAALVRIEKKLDARPASAGKAEGAVADDFDLDGQYGDPEIRNDPSQKYWQGPARESIT